MNADPLIRTQNFIAGRWCDASTGARLAVTNPADESLIAEVPDSRAADARAAVDAAQAAFPAWRAAPAKALALANDTPFGLAGYFYTSDIARVWRLADALEVGIVGINEDALAAEAAPFGGVKASGYGREGSTHGLDDYLRVKYLCQGGLS